VIDRSHEKGGIMKLSLHGVPDLEDVTEADIDRIIGGGEFGPYAVLGSRLN
jgi:hypothetical protein